jgi:hypothetical protein
MCDMSSSHLVVYIYILEKKSSNKHNTSNMYATQTNPFLALSQ